MSVWVLWCPEFWITDQVNVELCLSYRMICSTKVLVSYVLHFLPGFRQIWIINLRSDFSILLLNRDNSLRFNAESGLFWRNQLWSALKCLGWKAKHFPGSLVQSTLLDFSEILEASAWQVRIAVDWFFLMVLTVVNQVCSLWHELLFYLNNSWNILCDLIKWWISSFLPGTFSPVLLCCLMLCWLPKMWVCVSVCVALNVSIKLMYEEAYYRFSSCWRRSLCFSLVCSPTHNPPPSPKKHYETPCRSVIYPE